MGGALQRCTDQAALTIVPMALVPATAALRSSREMRSFGFTAETLAAKTASRGTCAGGCSPQRRPACLSQVLSRRLAQIGARIRYVDQRFMHGRHTHTHHTRTTHHTHTHHTHHTHTTHTPHTHHTHTTHTTHKRKHSQASVAVVCLSLGCAC